MTSVRPRALCSKYAAVENRLGIAKWFPVYADRNPGLGNKLVANFQIVANQSHNLKSDVGFVVRGFAYSHDAR